MRSGIRVQGGGQHGGGGQHEGGGQHGGGGQHRGEGGCNLFTTITPCLHHSVPPKRSIIGGINIINMNTGKIDSARDSSPANRGLI